MAIFQRRISNLKNVTLLRKTSGEAARSWNAGEPSLVFIDAVYDYVNVTHDIEVWSPKLADGGILALHDTDDRRFSGTRCGFQSGQSSRSLFDIRPHR